MKWVRDSFFLLVGLAVIIWSFYAFLQKPAPAEYQPADNMAAPQILTVGERKLIVEIADTDTLRMQGLSNRESLPAGHGMLFIFEEPGSYGFWMKDMRFPIDIVWLAPPTGERGGAYHAVDIERNISPGTFPHVFYPPTPVKYVLETNPGEL